MGSALAARLAQSFATCLKPPPQLNLVEWADAYRVLSPEAASSPGRWRTSKVEVARGPMHAITDPRVREVSVKCSTQLMKTELMLNTIGYYIHQDPAPIMVMQPTEKMAEAFSKDRLDTMLRDSPALAEKAGGKKRDSGNTILHKQFPGGHVTMVGANAPGNLAMRPIRVLLEDEINKYPPSAGDEGDPRRIAERRVATFWNHKIVRACSPTVEGACAISTAYEQGDRRVFCPPCPHCGARRELLFKNVRWDDGDPLTARYVCPDCETTWTEADRLNALRSTRDLQDFGWIAQAPFKGHASFRANKLASPWEPLSVLAREFLEVKDNPQGLKTFVNTMLAETFKSKGEQPPWESLYSRREAYARGTVPEGGVLLFAGVDVQRDRIELEVRAFGEGLESWSVDYIVIEGDTTDESTARSPWAKLTDVICGTWPHAVSGVAMPLQTVCVDSSDNTQAVYRWCNKQPSWVWPIKGDGGHKPVVVSPPKKIAFKRNGQRAPGSVQLRILAVDKLKEELYGFVKLIETEAGKPTGLMHWPEYPQEYFEQLTGEQLTERSHNGRTVYRWEKTRQRQEALDCAVYVRAASLIYGIDKITPAQWGALRADLSAPRKRAAKPRAKKVDDFWARR